MKPSERTPPKKCLTRNFFYTIGKFAAERFPDNLFCFPLHAHLDQELGVREIYGALVWEVEEGGLAEKQRVAALTT